VLLLAALGWGIGFILVITERNPLGGGSLTDPPEYLVFAFFAVAQTTLWAVVALPLIATLRRLRTYLSGNYLWIAVPLLILTVAVFSPLFFPPVEGTPPAHRTRVVISHTVGGLLGLLGIAGMFLIDAAARTLGLQPDNREVADFQCLRGDLTRLRTILAAVVGIVILAAGAYRYALIASGVVPEAAFPIALVLVYGAFFTVLLALAFVPAHLSLLSAGRRIRDLVCPLPPVTSEDFEQDHKRWKALGELMGLETSTAEAFQSGFAIFAPLTTAIVSVLLPT
jgi:hypothetical protein